MKKLVSVILVAALLSAYGIFAIASTESSEEEAKVDVSSSTESSESEDTTQTSNKITVHIGEKLTTDDFEINFVSYDNDFKDTNMFTEADEGKRIVRFYFECKNISDEDKSISTYDFECYADDLKCESASFWEDDDLSGTISSGRCSNGYVYFQVPEDSEKIELEYEYDFWDDKKAVFVVD